MSASKSKRSASIIRKIARIASLIIGIVVFLFALVSGSEDYGGGIGGIIKNSPNALPWAAFLIIAVAARKWELIGGIIITLFGLAATYFFNFSGPNFFLVTFIITTLITMVGLLFIIAWYIDRT